MTRRHWPVWACLKQNDLFRQRSSERALTVFRFDDGMTIMKPFAALIGLAALAACATPGIDYNARLMANAPAAAEVRDVTVDRFDGPAGGWFARRLENVLYEATFDGQPWFNVSAPGYGAAGPQGIYTGYVEVDDVWEDHSTNYRDRCIERDENEKCVKVEQIEEYCVRTDVRVSAHLELIDAQSGELIFANSYPGDASDYACSEYVTIFKTRKMGKGVRAFKGRSHNWNSFAYAPGTPGGLIRDALSDTLRPIRRDVAPRNKTVRAKFATTAIDPLVFADPRFEMAIKLAKDSPQGSCQLWTDMAAEYETAPAVTHNLGACAEAAGDYTGAQTLYAKAADLAGGTVDADAVAPILASLARISQRRNDQATLDALVGPGIVPES